MRFGRLYKNVLSLFLTLFLLAGCTAPAGNPVQTASPPPGILTLTTGSGSGTYYSFGNAAAETVGAHTATQVAVITSGGSAANIEAVRMGDADLGFSQSDVLRYAMDGTRLFQVSGAVSGLLSVAALYMEQVQIITLDESIRTVEDLRGRKVSIGANGSGVYFNALDILEAYGLDVEQDINASYQGFSDSTEALKNGELDAAFIVAGAPTPAVAALSETHTVHIVSPDEAHLQALIASSPYYRESSVPAGCYGLTEAVPTLAVAAVVFARADTPEEAVYDFLSGLFGHTDEISAAHDKGAELDLDFAAGVTTYPYHPGAVRFFKEQGITVPAQ